MVSGGFIRWGSDKKRVDASLDKDLQQPHTFRHWLVILTGVFFFAILVVVIFRYSPLGASKGGDQNREAVLEQTTPNGIPVRACMQTERICPGTMRCRGSDGGVVNPLAAQADGSVCCMFECEGNYLPIRACTASERVCSKNQKCKMGNNVVMPVALTMSGMSCCQFECDYGDDLPVRACNLGSEVECPAGSYCYDFSGQTTGPTAKKANGTVCCRANGTDSVCVPVEAT